MINRKPPPGLFGFFLCLAGDSFAWGISLGILFGMFSETYGLSDAQLGLMTSVMSVSMAVSQLPVGRLVDRYGCKPSMVFSEAIGLPLMLMWVSRLSRTFHRQFAVRARRAAVADHGYSGRNRRRDDGHHRAGQRTQDPL
jgi:MFS family permease